MAERDSTATTRDAPAPLALRKLPPEIRAKIFKQCLEWTGKTPALIVALRGKDQLYAEVLEIFYANNTFVLSKANDLKFGEMSPNALSTIRTMRVNVEASRSSTEDQHFVNIQVPPAKFALASNVRSLVVDYTTLHYFSDDAWSFLKDIFSRFSVLGRVEVRLIRYVAPPWDPHAMSWQAGNFLLDEDDVRMHMTNWVNDRFGVAGKWCAVHVASFKDEESSTGERSIFASTWFWEAPECQFLKKPEMVSEDAEEA